jgi:hypothetical protein
MTDKPALPDSLRTLALAARKRVKANRATAPLDDLTPKSDNYLSCPYAEQDSELWLCLLLDTFGTRNELVAGAFLHQLGAMIPSLYVADDPENKGHVPNPALFQMALSIICSLKPRNEAEAAIAIHSVALHLATLKVTDFMTSRSWLDPKSATALATITKAFTLQVKAMRELQTPARAKRQVIKVQKNVTINYSDERHVHLPGRGRDKSGNQLDGAEPLRAHATLDGEATRVPALPSSNTFGEVVPLSRSTGQENVPRSWERRSAEGKG